jgi:hemerythrin-like domain-containing protein
MVIQIGARPDSGFDDPLGMLKDCHRRIERFLGILCHVAERREEGPLTEEEISAVEAALHYFAEGGQLHNQDEEDSLFPRLRKVEAGDLEITHRLEDDHAEAEELHGRAADLFSAWISAGTIDSEDRQLLLSATGRLRTLYGEHIRVEEEIVFQHAARVLDAGVLREMGAEFRTRRNGAG